VGEKIVGAAFHPYAAAPETTDAGAKSNDFNA